MLSASSAKQLAQILSLARAPKCMVRCPAADAMRLKPKSEICLGIGIPPAANSSGIRDWGANCARLILALADAQGIGRGPGRKSTQYPAVGPCCGRFTVRHRKGCIFQKKEAATVGCLLGFPDSSADSLGRNSILEGAESRSDGFIGVPL